MYMKCLPSAINSGVGGVRLPHASRCSSGPPDPSEPMLYARMPRSGPAGSTNTAPAPSPNSGYVLMSLGLRTRLFVSPPITSARSLTPAFTYAAAVMQRVHEPGARGFHLDRGTD